MVRFLFSLCWLNQTMHWIEFAFSSFSSLKLSDSFLEPFNILRIRVNRDSTVFDSRFWKSAREFFPSRNVDAENGLTGVCDFLVSLSSSQFHLEAPAIILVEAKRDNLTSGLGQCVAEMVAAQRFNAEQGNDIPCVYGTTTSGIDWVFLKLEGKKLQLDMAAYTIERCDKILGILVGMAAQKA